MSITASRPLRRHHPPLRPVWLTCMRCEKPFLTPTITRECWLCNRASEKLYGTTHPIMEASGA